MSRLQKIWKDCVTDVPYYDELVRRRVAPREIKCWDDFRNIPELSRKDLQDQPEKFIRYSGPPELKRMTGGSTGTPVHFGVWKSEDRILRVLKLVLWQRAGYQPNSRIFLIWGHSHLLGTGWRRHVRHAQRKLKDWLLGYRRVDAYSLSPERCKSIARRLVAFRPVGIIGYASALDYLVRTTAEFADEFSRCGCRFVMPASEMAPRPDSRGLLRQTFNCALIEEYGGVDFGQPAMRYEDEPFEVFPEHYLLEASRVETPTGAEQAAILTTLYHRYTPLIRYRPGDALQGAEKLGHGHVKRFANLAGRCHDMVWLGGGPAIHSMAVFHCIHAEKSVLNIQMVLRDTGPRVRLAVTPEFDSSAEERVRHRLGQIAPQLSGVPIERAADIETTRAGKRRWLVDERVEHSEFGG
jgi:phenylacetate-coenzyme A ligase PaaK-like adenylate-forming protein